MGIEPEAERRNPALGTGERDVVRLDAFDAGTGHGLSLQLSIFATEAVMIGALLRPGRSAIGLVADEVPVPPVSQHWEIRGSGIWADHVSESPHDHWSYGLEAFALEVDEPTEIVESGVGRRVPLGWELEFEADFAPVPLAAGGSHYGYLQDGRVHGLVLDVEGEHDFDGVGVRSRWWGTQAPTSINVAAPASAMTSAIDLPDHDGLWRLDLSSSGLAARRMPWG